MTLQDVIQLSVPCLEYSEGHPKKLTKENY